MVSYSAQIKAFINIMDKEIALELVVEVIKCLRMIVFFLNIIIFANWIVSNVAQIKVFDFYFTQSEI